MSNVEIKIDDCWNRIGIWGKVIPKCPRLEEFVHCRNCDVFSSSGRKILDRPIPEDYQQEWTDEFSKQKTQALAKPNSALVFRLGDEWIAIPTQYVKEITSVGVIHKIPHKEGRFIKGLVNVRGELKICISMGNLLNLNPEAKKYKKQTRNILYQRLILITLDKKDFVFPVSEVHGLTRYNRQLLTAVPATLDRTHASFTDGVLEAADRRIACLEPIRLFEAMEKCLL
jgi:chemotaxis-related protein WspD